jgi:hypothetical protein
MGRYDGAVARQAASLSWFAEQRLAADIGPETAGIG